AEALGRRLGRAVPLVADWRATPPAPAAGELVLLENIRFAAGETDNDEALGRHLASMCDVFVMDAFAACHRAHASTSAAARLAPAACAGRLLQAEVAGLRRVFDRAQAPIIAALGGAKVSTKLNLLCSLRRRVDQLIVGGGMANTMLAAGGVDVGASLFEPDMLDEARALLEGGSILLPVDALVRGADGSVRISRLNEIAPDEAIFDIGPASAEAAAEALGGAGGMIWNGPMGVFEQEAFAQGTRAVARAIAGSAAYSVAGGGDTLAAIEAFGLGVKPEPGAPGLSCISTGGGAFLEYLEVGEALPGIAALQRSG
ncbi:MAG: phosphoglycerate kinase, partial [Gammaproteobacteria bacterium AqS3]|nr:phosphoglycerate kinase [Gammaproteobacteria bacterium AqS3]